MHNKSGPQKLVGEVQLFRIRVAAAETRVKLLREQAQQANRRRKEAKRLAQRARKLFKQSKAELAELAQALGKAETKLLKAGGKVVARRLARRRASVARRTQTLVRASVPRPPRRRMPQTLVTARPGSRLRRVDSVLSLGRRRLISTIDPLDPLIA
jgi:hypothetical protein